VNLCEADLLKSEPNSDMINDKVCIDFVEVRTRRGKLLFRFDPVRMLVDWREGQEGELIDLMPYLTR
jgi:hypothetical protein